MFSCVRKNVVRKETDELDRTESRECVSSAVLGIANARLSSAVSCRNHQPLSDLRASAPPCSKRTPSRLRKPRLDRPMIAVRTGGAANADAVVRADVMGSHRHIGPWTIAADRDGLTLGPRLQHGEATENTLERTNHPSRRHRSRPRLRRPVRLGWRARSNPSFFKLFREELQRKQALRIL